MRSPAARAQPHDHDRRCCSPAARWRREPAWPLPRLRTGGSRDAPARLPVVLRHPAGAPSPFIPDESAGRFRRHPPSPTTLRPPFGQNRRRRAGRPARVANPFRPVPRRLRSSDQRGSGGEPTAIRPRRRRPAASLLRVAGCPRRERPPQPRQGGLPRAVRSGKVVPKWGEGPVRDGRSPVGCARSRSRRAGPVARVQQAAAVAARSSPRTRRARRVPVVEAGVEEQSPTPRCSCVPASAAEPPATTRWMARAARCDDRGRCPWRDGVGGANGGTGT